MDIDANPPVPRSVPAFRRGLGARAEPYSGWCGIVSELDAAHCLSTDIRVSVAVTILSVQLYCGRTLHLYLQLRARIASPRSRLGLAGRRRRDLAGGAEDKGDDRGHGAVEFRRDFVFERDRRERLGEGRILLQRHAVG